ncbi:MAG TPA: sulfur carrier protein ThiS adenylyltransferase ThiF [Bacteroidales bacterium]|nr:sulfur carrier protein ThiS adenylyltransferase ThiF [Bacteroidales bacterium]
MTFDKIKEIVSKKVVGIAGCGGLGSNAAVALARVGVGKLIIADFDVIVESNLNRQYFFYDQIGQKKCEALKINIHRINPSCIVEAHDTMLNETSIVSLYKNVDVMIEAFDKAEMKEMILSTMIEHLPKIPLIMGSGLAGWGNFQLIQEQAFDNIYIMGDGINEVSDELPPLAPRVGIVANMQANKALEILIRQ